MYVCMYVYKEAYCMYVCIIVYKEAYWKGGTWIV